MRDNIHNWLLQPCSQDYGLASHITYVVWVILIYKWRDLQFKVDSGQQIFKKLLMAILFTLRLFARNLLRGNRTMKYFLYFFFNVRPGARTRALRLMLAY